jgi:hypothetical protein
MDVLATVVSTKHNYCRYSVLTALTATLSVCSHINARSHTEPACCRIRRCRTSGDRLHSRVSCTGSCSRCWSDSRSPSPFSPMRTSSVLCLILRFARTHAHRHTHTHAYTHAPTHTRCVITRVWAHRAAYRRRRACTDFCPTTGEDNGSPTDDLSSLVPSLLSEEAPPSLSELWSSRIRTILVFHHRIHQRCPAGWSADTSSASSPQTPARTCLAGRISSTLCPRASWVA